MKVKNCCLILQALWLLSACDSSSTTQSVASSPERAYKIICLGDGLTAGVGVPLAAAFPVRLADTLASIGYTVKVVNGGIKGETLTGLQERVQWILQQRFDAMLLLLGRTELAKAEPTDAVMEQWKQLIATIHQAHPSANLTIGVPAGRPMNWPLAAFSDQYAVRFVDLAKLGQQQQYWQKLDGSLYLSPDGQQFLADLLLPSVLESLQHE